MTVTAIYRPTPPEMIVWDGREGRETFGVSIEDMIALLHQYERVNSIHTTYAESQGVVLATTTIIIDDDEKDGLREVSATSGERVIVGKEGYVDT